MNQPFSIPIEELIAAADRRRTNPLMAWRMTQSEPERGGKRLMRVADAARGIGVPYQTWDGWEKDEGEPGHRKPDPENMRRIFLFTRGAIRPDHFYPIGEWRRQLADQAEAEPAGEA